MDPICWSPSAGASADSPARLPGHLPGGHRVAFVTEEMCHVPLPGLPLPPSTAQTVTPATGPCWERGMPTRGEQGCSQECREGSWFLHCSDPSFPFLLWLSCRGISPGHPSMSRNSGEGPCPCQGWEHLDETWPGCAGTGSGCRGGTGRSLGTWAGRHRCCASPAKDDPSLVAEGSRR